MADHNENKTTSYFLHPKHPKIHEIWPRGMTQTLKCSSMKFEKVRKSELTREKPRLLWEDSNGKTQ